MAHKSNKIHIFEIISDLNILKTFLKSLNENIILTIEESTGTQWLYTEPYSFVEKLLVCNPYKTAFFLKDLRMIKLTLLNFLKQSF